jgi:hypothetical protein
MWLSQYDLVALFGDETQAVSATLDDAFLKEIVKAISVWYLLRLANVNVDMALALTWYEKAIGNLSNIQKGKMSPAWPYADTTDFTAPDGDAFYTVPANKDMQF